MADPSTDRYLKARARDRNLFIPVSGGYQAGTVPSNPTISNSATLLTDLVSYYSFDGTTYTDDLHGSNDGTAEGTITKDTTNYKLGGNSVNFLGTGDIALGDCFKFTGAFTVSMWVKDNYTTPTVWDGLIGNYDVAGSLGWLIASVNVQGKIFCRMIDATYNTRSLNVRSSAGAISSTEFTHVIFQYDGGVGTDKVHFYIDGTEDSQEQSMTSGWASLGASAKDSVIGNAAPTSTRYLEMNLDEIGVWGRALTSDERAYLYNDGDGVPYA